jgi:ribosomal protein S18 acetylase RimI-like enzyme
MKTEQNKKHPKITIREMNLDDLAPVYHLGEKLFTAIEVPNLYRTWDEYELVELFSSDSDLCQVAEAEKRLIGFALGTTIEKERSAWKYGHLVWLGVLPEYQRSGVAAKLFNHIKELMIRRGVRIIIVDTEADNLSALHFFRRMGFGKPEEHIYLSLNLSGQRKPQNGGRVNDHTEFPK